MKRNVIITGIAVLTISTGIISYMVAAQPQKQAPNANVESLVVPETQEVITESTPTQEVVTEAPVPVQRVQEETRTTGNTATINREEVSAIVSSTVSANWNAKETGIMISNANIISLIMKTYDGSPEAFESNSPENVTLTCIDRLKTMNKEEAIRFVYGDSCL